MRPRIVMLLAFVIAAVAVGFTGARFTYLPATPPAVHAPLPPTPASYLGVFEPRVAALVRADRGIRARRRARSRT